ncbi:MAG TPA: WD40 repeat domain-containing protein, partial [Phototrophicaceae bacterium]|nr:WD40 repeat domain-containing protein [Phototrophicaceae bacterium]
MPAKTRSLPLLLPSVLFAWSVALLLMLTINILAQSSDPAGEAITPENAADVRYIDNLKQASQEQTGLVWSPQGRQLAIAGMGGIWIYEWTAEGRRLVRQLETKLQMEGLAYSSDGSLLIASRQGEALTWLWDIETGNLAATFQLGGVLGFVADDSLIALRTDHGVDFWGIPGGEVITPENAYRLKYIASIKATDDEIAASLLQIALSPDGHSIAFVYQHDFQDKPYTVSHWDIATHQSIWTQEFGADKQSGTGATINNKLITFTPDSQQIAVYQGNKDKTISLFNADDGNITAVLESDPGELSAMSMAFTPDGRVLAVAALIAHSADDHEFVLDLWDVEHQTLAARLDSVVSLYHDLAFSSDGALLAGIFPYEP